MKNMKIDIKCEVDIKEVTINFGSGGDHFGNIKFKANVYLLNNSNLRVREELNFQCHLEPDICQLIKNKLEREAIKTLS